MNSNVGMTVTSMLGWLKWTLLCPFSPLSFLHYCSFLFCCLSKWESHTMYTCKHMYTCTWYHGEIKNYGCYRPIARDVIIQITGNIRKSGSHVGVPLIGASTFCTAISANIVPLVLQVFTGQNQVGPVLWI